MKKIHFLAAAVVIAAIAGCSLLSCMGAVALPGVLIFRSLKTHPAYTMGMDLARNDPAVVELFGSPVEEGFLVDGTVQSYREGGDTATLESSLSGPKASGKIYIYATQVDKGGAWQIDSINIRVADKPVLSYQGSEADKGFQPVGDE